MAQLMRCQYCGTLQDEPVGAKTCVNCGGALAFVPPPSADERNSYLQAQLELDQVQAPAGQNIERYLLATLRTPTQVPLQYQAPTQQGRPPINFVAALDVSGSMSGHKLVQAKQALRQAVAHLADGDIFGLVVFSTQVEIRYAPRALTAQARQIVLSAIQEIATYDSTNLCGGLELGLAQARVSPQATNLVMLISDGLANHGITDIEEIAQRATQGRRDKITVSTIGVGEDYNEALMIAIADQGGGHFCHVADPNELARLLTAELGDVVDVAVREARWRLNLPTGSILTPLSAAYLIEQNGQTATVTIGDLPRDVELEIPLRLTCPAQTNGLRLDVDGVIEYQSPAGGALKTRLNRVTVRIVETQLFHENEGVALPIAERVLEQIKSASVLNVARALRASPQQAQEQERARLKEVARYAKLLGQDRVDQEVDATGALFQKAAAPATSKQTVMRAFEQQRSYRRKPKDQPK